MLRRFQVQQGPWPRTNGTTKPEPGNRAHNKPTKTSLFIGLTDTERFQKVPSLFVRLAYRYTELSYTSSNDNLSASTDSRLPASRYRTVFLASLPPSGQSSQDSRSDALLKLVIRLERLTPKCYDLIRTASSGALCCQCQGYCLRSSG